MLPTQYAKVIDSNFSEDKIAKKMIGSIFEIEGFSKKDKVYSLYTIDKESRYHFNFSDVLPATEEEYKAQFEVKEEKKGEIEEIDVEDYKSLWEMYSKTIEKVNELVRAVNKIK